MKRHAVQHRNRRGFTLLELIVVITIIGILGTFVITRISGSADRARQAKRKNDLSAIYRAAQMIHAQTGEWPASIDEMVNPSGEEDGEIIAGGLNEVPMNPWSLPYQWEEDENGNWVAWCYGKDDQEGDDGKPENKDMRYPPEQDY